MIQLISGFSFCVSKNICLVDMTHTQKRKHKSIGELGGVLRYRGGQVVNTTTVQNQSRKGNKRAQLEDDHGQAHKVHVQSHAPNQSSSLFANLERCNGEERMRHSKLRLW